MPKRKPSQAADKLRPIVGFADLVELSEMLEGVISYLGGLRCADDGMLSIYRDSAAKLTSRLKSKSNKSATLRRPRSGSAAGGRTGWNR